MKRKRKAATQGGGLDVRGKPVSASRSEMAEVVLPTLSVHDRVALDNAMML